MSDTNIDDLSPEILTNIVEYFDWRTRINCERVSRTFREVCEDMHFKTIYPYVGLPRPIPITLSVSGYHYRSRDRGPKSYVSPDDILRIHFYIDDQRYKEMLENICSKFGPYTKLLELTNYVFTSNTIHVLRNYESHLRGKLKVKRLSFCQRAGYCI